MAGHTHPTLCKSTFFYSVFSANPQPSGNSNKLQAQRLHGYAPLSHLKQTEGDVLTNDLRESRTRSRKMINLQSGAKFLAVLESRMVPKGRNGINTNFYFIHFSVKSSVSSQFNPNFYLAIDKTFLLLVLVSV